VRAASRLGDLHRRRDAAAAGRLTVGKRVEHRGRAVEVRDQKAAAVVGQQRIQPDEHVADQVGGDDLGRQREVGSCPAVQQARPTHTQIHTDPKVAPRTLLIAAR
jgi:hypothetical protein